LTTAPPSVSRLCRKRGCLEISRCCRYPRLAERIELPFLTWDKQLLLTFTASSGTIFIPNVMITLQTDRKLSKQADGTT
jgi:hypothetical protein